MQIHVNTPQYIRLPKRGTFCPYTGLSRTGLNELILPCHANNFRPPVKSFVHKSSKHNIRGIRLIVYASLMDHLRHEMDASGINDSKDTCDPSPGSSLSDTKSVNSLLRDTHFNTINRQEGNQP